MLKSKLGRAFITGFAMTLFLDAIISWAGAKLLFEHDMLFGFWAILAVLLIAPLLFGLKTIVYKAIGYQFTKNKTRKVLIHEFRKAALPLFESDVYVPDAEQYFSLVSNEDQLPKSAITFATQTIGQLALIPKYSLADTFIVHANLDAALEDYFDELRRDDTPPIRPSYM